MANIVSGTSKQIFHINTFTRDSGTTEYFKHTVPIPSNSGADSVVVLQASIPSSFYLIQDGLNTFGLVEDGVTTTITVPPGNYSARVFASVVSTLMTTASPNHWTYSITLPGVTAPSTGKFTYSVTGNS